MLRKIIPILFVLLMALSLAACGNTQTAANNAGDAVSRWRGDPASAEAPENTTWRRSLTDGTTLEGERQDSFYHAGKDGRVDGYDKKGTSDGGSLTRDMKNIAKSIGDAAEDTLDKAENAVS